MYFGVRFLYNKHCGSAFFFVVCFFFFDRKVFGTWNYDIFNYFFLITLFSETLIMNSTTVIAYFLGKNITFK